jgi:hypothetical protein
VQITFKVDSDLVQNLPSWFSNIARRLKSGSLLANAASTAQGLENFNFNFNFA